MDLEGHVTTKLSPFRLTLNKNQVKTHTSLSTPSNISKKIISSH